MTTAQETPPALRTNHRPLAVELRACPDPWDAFLRISHLPNALFLDSNLPETYTARYSFITAEPVEFITFRNGWITHSTPSGINKLQAQPFEFIQKRLLNYQSNPIPELPPFQGGLAGVFSYDLCHNIEKLPRPLYDEFTLPEIAVGIYDWVISYDNLQQQAWIISHGIRDQTIPKNQKLAEENICRLRALLGEQSPRPAHASMGRPPLPKSKLSPLTQFSAIPNLYSNFSKSEYLNSVEKIIDYIYDGDIFQANLSQRLLAPSKTPSLELYSHLRKINPGTFAAYFDAGFYQLLSASPERFLKVSDRIVETRPIKGTRPRGYVPIEDMAQQRELTESIKDSAENVMIVDLLRNDLSKVSQPGSVKLNSLCQVRSNNYVHHLVSTIQATLRPTTSPFDLLRATFPGGSITGAPKVRAMEIISELESTVRGPYCGSLGYIGFDGSMDASILIRSFIVARGWLQFSVGGGIVAKSDPEKEYTETLHKAEGLLRVLQTIN
tara:strand:- start:301 stop:1791 length:1491 start_codon:yes stop_codon:yes gene_type:complete